MILEKVYDELMAQIEDLKKAVAGGTGSKDYDKLDNRPKVNNITLTGNKKSSDLKIAYSMTEAEYAAATKNTESIYCLQENATSFEEEDETASASIEWSAGDPSGYVATWVYYPSNQDFTGCTAVDCDDAAITIDSFSAVGHKVQVFLSSEDTSQIGETVTFTFTLTQSAGATRIIKNGLQFGGLQFGADETVIGTWIDGHPLYANYVDTTASMNGNTWADITTITGAKYVVQLILFVNDENGNTSYPALASINPRTGKIEGMHFRSTSITFNKALIIYTK